MRDEQVDFIVVLAAAADRGIESKEREGVRFD